MVEEIVVNTQAQTALVLLTNLAKDKKWLYSSDISPLTTDPNSYQCHLHRGGYVYAYPLDNNRTLLRFETHPNDEFLRLMNITTEDLEQFDGAVNQCLQYISGLPIISTQDMMRIIQKNL